LFVSNSLMGQVGGLYGNTTPTQFWLLDAAISASGAIIVLLFGRAITRGLTACSSSAGVARTAEAAA
jgi:hypothetical protein